MYEALMEIMEPQIKLRKKAVLRKCIQGAVDLLCDAGQRNDKIKIAIMNKYHLAENEAEEYMCGAV